MSGTRGGGAVGSNAVNGRGGSGGVAVSIPQASKKMVQSLKEIVNCPEAEIYSMLKECDMDPNEAVNRLLSQDPFHEVKSKRDKKKETKDATDSRSRGGNSTSNRGGRGGNERRGRESGALRAKPSYKKDNGATYTSSSSGPGVVGNNINWNPPPVSETPLENKAPVFNVSEGVPSFQPSAGFRSPWSAVPGQLSMADIVKMGRPQGRASSNVNSSHHSVSHHHATASQAAPTPHELYSSQSHAAKVNVDMGVAVHSTPPDDDWPQDEQQPTLGATSISEPHIPEPYKDPSVLPFDGSKHHLDDVQYSEDTDGDLRRSNMQDESSVSAPTLNDELHDSINSYHVDRRVYEQQEAEGVGVSVSSIAANIQQLNLSREEEEEEDEEEYEEDEEEEADVHQGIDSPAVKIPDHLVVQSADCSHLSFGSFGSGMGAPFSGPFASISPKSNVVETSTAPSAPPVGYTDARNSDYYDDEHRTASDGNSDHRLAVSSGSYDMPSASQPETLKQESAEAVVGPGNEYSFPSSSPNYTYENSQQEAQDQHLNPSFSHSQISSQMQNLPLSGLMSHPHAMPSSLLPSNVQTARDAELSYLPFPITQSMPTKYNSSLASMNGPSNSHSVAEAMKAGSISSPQLTQNLPGGSISGGPAFPQHLPLHPYSQPSLPFANMIGYPFLPQSYTYMPSAFQQAIAAAGNSTYHQSLSAASLLPQYKNNVPVSSLPQSATVPSGYGAFGSSTNVPGNFSLNPPPSAAAPPATTMSYDDVLSSQYKDAAHMLALQQNESSPLWVQGPGSRTMSAVPASTYYSFQGQNQQPPGYRQTQHQPSQQQQQHYGNPGGYPNFYHHHNQSGVPLEQHQQQQQQQQMSRDGSLGGSQGQQQPKQPQQIWQNSY